MPSKKQYNLVHNDEYDTRIPLHSEEAFHRGIVFHAKFIGSMEVPRPTSRMEIVAAMRRIRYEFKAKGIKKKKVTLEVSVDGLKVTLRKKKAFIDAHGQYFDPLLKRVNLQFPILQKKQQYVDENKLVLMHHPIYRIFYVSHDSHDLKIFSYIARDGSGNSFRCNVFKSSKKSQAMRVVRTVGQAFEVCHKLSLNNPAGGGDRTTSTTSDDQQQTRVAGDGENHRRDGLDEYDDRDELGSIQPQPSPSSVHKDISLLGDAEDSILDQPCPLRTQPAEVTTTTTTTTTTCPASPVRQSPLGNIISDQLMNGELTTLKHEIQLLRERLDQQSQQTRAAVAHARLLQDQLAAETAARVEAQARTHQLLVQNKELLEHIAALVSHLREHERISGVPMSGQPSSQVVTSSGTLSQNSPAADISALGQYNSTWDPHGPLYSRYSPLTSPCYPGILSNGPYGFARPICDNYAEELRYQAQLWENLRVGNPYATSIPLSPYSPTTTTTTTTTIPHCYGPGCSLPPSGRSLTQRFAQTPSSPISTLPRASRVPRSPTRYQQRATSAPRSRSLERPVQHNTGTVDNNDVDFATREAFFIKPLPCNCQRNCDSRSTIRGCNKSTPPTPLKSNLHDLMRPLVLDSPPSVRKNCYSEHLSRGVQTEPSFYQQNNCPLILLTESKSVKSSGDSMPKIDESEDLESDEEQENDERSVQMPKPIRRNSQ